MMLHKNTATPYPRTQWPRALTAFPSDEIIAKIEAVSANMNIAYKSQPQSGLGLLKMQDSAFQQPYFLGEFPFSSVWVAVTTEQGLLGEGSAQIMDDDVELAQAIAVSDAIVSAQLEGCDAIIDLIEQGMKIRARESQIRKAMLHKTAVDFSMLSEAEDESIG